MSEQILAQIGVKLLEEKEQGERIRDLRQRSARCICRYCGSKLSLRKITYAAYDESKIEIFCEQCGRLEYGVEPEIYKLAAYYVDEMQYDHYPNLDESASKRRMNIAAVCNILNWGFKNTKLLSADGFQIDVKLDEEFLDEAILISDKKLREMEMGAAHE